MAIAAAGIDPFIPEIWSAAIMEPFEKTTVFAQSTVANHDYQGEITRLGDSVHVSSIGKPTVRTYDAATDLIIEDLSVTDTKMTIDQGDYFAFRVEDVAAVQAAGPVKDPALKQASVKMSDKVDKYIAGIFKAGAKKKIGQTKIVNDSPDRIGKGQISAWKAVVMMQKELNAESVPHLGRFLIVGPEFHSALLMDERFTRVDASGDADGLRNGIVGRAAGFDIMVSNNIPTTSTRELLCAGVPSAISFASQIIQVEPAREEKRFADIVKGLQIYGAKVFHPEGLVTLDADVADPIASA